MKNFSNKKFFEFIADNSPVGIVVCDEKNNIIYTNKKFIEISKTTNDNLINQPLNKVIKENQETYFINEKEVNVSINKTENLKILSVSEPNEESTVCQAHLDFVSTVSHELRTPLTSIKGFSDTLLSASDKLSKEQQHKFLSIIKNQIDRLTRLVENLLTVTKLESKQEKIILKSINFKTFIEPLITAIKSKFSDHNFKVIVSKNLPEIWTDGDKLEQIMINLIDNAAKYSKPNTTVTINADYNSDHIVIKIIDEGIGISEKHLKNIFNKFSRIDNPLTREIQGTGLGLYITKNLVDNINGKIFVQSSHQGSVFKVELPIINTEKQINLKVSKEQNNA